MQFTHPENTIIGNLQPIEVEDSEVSNILWTTDGMADTTNSPISCHACCLNQAFSQSTTI